MKAIIKGLAMACVVAATAATPASAQILVSGTASGCFYGGTLGTTNCVAGAPTTILGLTYTGSTFSDFTNASGRVDFGGNPTPNPGGPVINFNNFGSFNLASAPAADYTGAFFKLFLTFSSPQITTGSYTATLNGSVSGTGGGGVQVGFGFLDTEYRPVDGSGILVHVNTLNVNPGNVDQQLSGSVLVSPEPASMTLLATGLVGVFGAAVRRRRASSLV